jgi:hypothetical protein
MATSETNSAGGESESSLVDTLRTVGRVIWALFALAVAAVVLVLVWAAVDLGPAVGPADPVPYLALLAAGVVGTVGFVLVSVLDA